MAAPHRRDLLAPYDPGLGALVPGVGGVGAPTSWSGPPVNRWALGGYEPGSRTCLRPAATAVA